MNSAPSSIGLPKYQRGVGMVEVLITALVLAIGLLGLSALQLTALKNNHSSMQRSIAVVQSYTIIEAIRANPESAKQELFNINLNGTPGKDSFPATVHTMWYEQLKQNLGPSATGSVSCQGNKCTIIVQWDNSHASQGTEETTPTQVITEVLL